MKHNSSRSSGNPKVQSALNHQRCSQWLRVCCLVLCAALLGCESLQRKLTRKSKQPLERPNPIISFQDYMQAMTPLDRYRKHYLMFDYWNDELIKSLAREPINPKRFKRSSAESLQELLELKRFLSDELSANIAPIIKERSDINLRLQSGSFSQTEASFISRVLEAQTRQIHREFFWRDVAESINAPSAPAASTAPSTSRKPSTPNNSN